MTKSVFDCRMCGHCCQGQGGIVASAPERERLAAYLNMAVEEFCARYTEAQGKKLVLRCGDNGYCVFFDPKTACTVHPAKPDVCRAWPFFRGNLVDPASWELAQEYCPGIRPECGHAEFARQGIAYMVDNGLTKTGREDEANALRIADLTEKNLMRLSECYSLLEVSPGASLDEIKASYRKLAFKYHPDLNAGDAHAAQRFGRLNEAYVLLKKNLETESSDKRRFNAETIRQEEEARVKRGGKPSGGFSAKQEEVLRDILNDPFAKQVFEDIFSKLKRGDQPEGATSKPVTTKKLDLKWGERAVSLDLGKGLVQNVKDWAAGQLDDRQTVRMPAHNLIPGTTLRVMIRHRFSPEPRTIDVTLPTDFVVGRPIRLKGMGRRLGPWRGDLYLRLLAI